MKDNAFNARLIVASTLCAFGGALMLPAGALAEERRLQVAASDSYWCKLFPSTCSDASTPGGVQNAPDGAAPGDAPMAPANSPAVEAPAPAAPAAAPPTSPPPTPPSDKPAQ